MLVKLKVMACIICTSQKGKSIKKFIKFFLRLTIKMTFINLAFLRNYFGEQTWMKIESWDYQ